MRIIFYILIGYLAGAVVVGIRLGWHMVTRLDQFDWRYSKSHIWTSFVLSVLFWPFIFFLSPKTIVNPTNLFEEEYGLAKRMREESHLWSNPPPCGASILYQQGSGRYEETFGEFIFRSGDIEKVLEDKLDQNAHLANGHEGAILNWLRQRDDSLTEPTPVPKTWHRFQFIADDVLRKGLGEIRCLKCNKPVPKNDLLQNDDHGLPGWNFNRLACPYGHPLLIVEKMHLLMKHK